MVLELARPSEARCSPPGGDFFEAVLLQQPQATEAVEKGCFSRIQITCAWRTEKMMHHTLGLCDGMW